MGFLSYLVVVGVGGVATLVPPLAVPIAGMLGIGSTGIVGGTIAAVAQSYVGNIAAGSTLAILQSAAMAPVLP